MIECLKQELLYSEKRARDAIFAVIEELLGERQREPLIVARLTREASLRAPHAQRATGYSFSNWPTAGKAVVNALLRSGSLLDDRGAPISSGVTANAAVATALCDRYQDRTEAFLLETIVARLGDVTLRDHTALAHALFRQFDPRVSIHDLEDRVVVLLARLADRLELLGGRYTVKRRFQVNAG